MGSLVRGSGRLLGTVLALALGAGISPGPAALADGGGPPGPGPVPPCPSCGQVHSGQGHSGHGHAFLHKRRYSGVGTLGYGPPGLFPGFQGFSLGYHPGYGYGEGGLGVGAEGGYPFYGGPGYPHPWPVLHRLHRIEMFGFYGGPGGPTPDHPNYFGGGVGPLVPDQPVVTTEYAPGDPRGYTNYGYFTGAVPNPEALFARFTAIAAAGGSASGVASPNPTAPPGNAPPLPGTSPFAAPLPPGPGLTPPSEPSAPTPPAGGATRRLPPQARSLGIDAEPFVDPEGVRGMRVTRVNPGTVAERAGLRVGDVIRSINGFTTTQQEDLPWILTNAAPDRVLRMTVRAASNGQVRTVTTQLP